VIENYFRYLTKDPLKTANWYAQTAALDWVTGDGTRILGQHSIFQFFKTLPELVYEVMSYDCHPITADPLLTMLVVSGEACSMQEDQRRYSFHTTMHIQRNESEAIARIIYQSFHLFRM
jgi:hypothetical protein